jgi:membrane-associated protease RseP (regulator of RpoE activity)
MRKSTNFTGNATLWRVSAIVATLMLIATVVTIQAGPAQPAHPAHPAAPAPDSDVGFLGVQLEEETDYAEGGARVTGVVADSPAEAAGIEEGDIIVGFDSRAIHGPAGLTKRIHSRQAGDDVQLTIVREGAELTLNVELGERQHLMRSIFIDDGGEWTVDAPDIARQIREQYETAIEGFEFDGDFTFDCDDDSDDCTNVFEFDIDEAMPQVWVQGDAGDYNVFFGGKKPMLGVQLVEATNELREFLGGSSGAGVLVSKVISDSPAQEGGMLVGDLIVSIDGETVADVNDIRHALSERWGDTFEIEVIREQREVSLDVTLPQPDESEPSGPRASLEPLHLQHELMAEARHRLMEASQQQEEVLQRSMELAEEALSRSQEAVEFMHQRVSTIELGAI